MGVFRQVKKVNCPPTLSPRESQIAHVLEITSQMWRLFVHHLETNLIGTLL